MADEILTPGKPGISECEFQESKETQNYLIKDNYFSEFETESDRQMARRNLEIYSQDEVYTKQETDNNLKKEVGDAIRNHLAEDDPHQIMSKVDTIVEDLVRQDGTTPFTAPQTGVNPVSDFHLTTKKFVTDLLNAHINRQDPHNVMALVREALQAYVEKSQVYLKRELYTKQEVDRMFSPYVTKDGNTPFLRPQIGVTPTLDNHLATKKYVDQSIYSHLVDVDPHGFITILNQRLARYYSKNETYSKAETYSRAQIDGIVYRLVADAAKSALEEHINQSDPHHILDQIWNKHYVTRDGSVAFTNPQQGVAGEEDNDLVVLSQLKALKEEIEQKVDDNQPIWITSGPVQTTVGFVETDAVLPNEMSFQEVMDAIFYGKRVKLTVPELSPIGEKFLITLCIQGSLATVEYVEIYQNGENIGLITREQLQESNCVTIDSLPIEGDAEIVAKVFYTNGSIHEVTAITKVSLPVFVGIINRWQFNNTVTYEQLLELHRQDPQNNIFYDKGEHMQELTHNFNFDEDLEQKIIIALPTNYSNLDKMYNSAQMVTVDAFDVINMIPFTIPGASEDVIYKLYSYKQDLYSLNSEITFKFK